MIGSRAKGALLAGGLFFCPLADGVLHPAQAQLLVFDSSSFGQLLDEAQNGLREIAQLEQVVTLSQQQLNEVTTFYTSFSHLTNVSQLAPFLLQQQAINPLPQVTQIENLLRGQGFGGSLAGQSQAILARVQHYQAVGTDFTATEMNSNAQATAGQMASAEALYSSSTQRITGIQQLQGQLALSADPKQSLDLQARATMENGLAEAQANQSTSMLAIQRAQADAEQQRVDQDWRKGAEGLTTSAAGWSGE